MKYRIVQIADGTYEVQERADKWWEVLADGWFWTSTFHMSYSTLDKAREALRKHKLRMDTTFRVIE